MEQLKENIAKEWSGSIAQENCKTSTNRDCFNKLSLSIIILYIIYILYIILYILYIIILSINYLNYLKCNEHKERRKKILVTRMFSMLSFSVKLLHIFFELPSNCSTSASQKAYKKSRLIDEEYGFMGFYLKFRVNYRTRLIHILLRTNHSEIIVLC